MTEEEITKAVKMLKEEYASMLAAVRAHAERNDKARAAFRGVCMKDECDHADRESCLIMFSTALEKSNATFTSDVIELLTKNQDGQ